MAVRQNLLELCKKIGDGHYVIDEFAPEYEVFEPWMSDDQITLLMAMDLLQPAFVEVVAADTGFSEEKTLEMLLELANIGVVAKANKMGTDIFALQLHAPGLFEFMLLNEEFCDAHPEVARAFHGHATRALSDVGPTIPMGAGVMRAIPVEKALPTEVEIGSVDRISRYIEKCADRLALAPCQCRRVRRYMGEGNGEPEGGTDLETGMCMFLGMAADMFIASGRAKKITKEQAYEKLDYFAKLGCVHQITTLDPGKSMAICNCQPNTCLALGATQSFNLPDATRSNFEAVVDEEKCVACGQCVEHCPNTALKLGQKLCTEKPIVHKQFPQARDTQWGPAYWNPDYRDNRENVVPTGTAPCKTACPAHIAVQGYIKLASQGKYLEALELIKKENPFPAICGRVCPHNCENECTRADFDEAIAIDEIKKFIADKELTAGTRFVPKKLYKFDQKIAIVGSGPAGLSCAYYLAEYGYNVTVFEKEAKLGGMMTLGIPSFRLEKDVVEAEIDVLRELGVEFKCGVNVGRDITIADLRAQGYSAFYLAIGAQAGRKLVIEGEESEGVQYGIDFLRNVNLGKPDKISGKVVVIGGGNVAIDVARTALRENSGTTEMYCLEGPTEMAALPEEIEEAKTEGIVINHGWGPARIIAENGKVTAIEFKKCVSILNEDGRFAPQYDDDTTKIVPADHVLISVGQGIIWDRLLNVTQVGLQRSNAASADSLTYQTADPDIFVGGDCYTGPRFAIDAIAAGKEAANSIFRYARPGHSLTIGRNRRVYKSLDKENLDKTAIRANGFDDTARQKFSYDHAKAKTYKDDRMTFTEEQMKKETARCLGCGATILDPNRCLGCGVCTTMCMFDAITLKRVADQPCIPYFERHEAVAEWEAKRKHNIKVKLAQK